MTSICHSSVPIPFSTADQYINCKQTSEPLRFLLLQMKIRLKSGWKTPQSKRAYSKMITLNTAHPGDLSMCFNGNPPQTKQNKAVLRWSCDWHHFFVSPRETSQAFPSLTKIKQRDTNMLNKGYCWWPLPQCFS